VQISRGEVSEEELKMRREKALADPAIQNILKDPVMGQVIITNIIRITRSNITSDPKWLSGFT
jgi:hypothetical protein